MDKVMQYMGTRLGATVAVNLALQFCALLVIYLGALGNDQQDPATECLPGSSITNEI